jgi:hypothetical protein
MKILFHIIFCLHFPFIEFCASKISETLIVMVDCHEKLTKCLSGATYPSRATCFHIYLLWDSCCSVLSFLSYVLIVFSSILVISIVSPLIHSFGLPYWVSPNYFYVECNWTLILYTGSIENAFIC